MIERLLTPTTDPAYPCLPAADVFVSQCYARQLNVNGLDTFNTLFLFHFPKHENKLCQDPPKAAMQSPYGGIKRLYLHQDDVEQEQQTGTTLGGRSKIT